jgi:hypothetical protein
MEFQGSKAFEVEQNGLTVRFSVLSAYVEHLVQKDLFQRKEYFATGKASVMVDAQNPDEAIGAVEPLSEK